MQTLRRKGKVTGQEGTSETEDGHADTVPQHASHASGIKPKEETIGVGQVEDEVSV